MKFPHLVHNPKLGYILPKRLYVRLRGVGSGGERQKPGPQGSSQLGGVRGGTASPRAREGPQSPPREASQGRMEAPKPGSALNIERSCVREAILG